MNLYTTRVDCEVGGQWRVAGVPFTLTDAQAAELTPPFGSVVALLSPPKPATEEAPPKEPVNGRLNRRQRRNRKTAE